MVEPVSMIAVAGVTSVLLAPLKYLGAKGGEAVLQGVSDRSCQSLALEIKDRTISHIRLPANHDLERGLRTAQMQALLHVLRCWRKTLPKVESGTMEMENERIFAERARRHIDQTFRKSWTLRFNEDDIRKIEEFAGSHLGTLDQPRGENAFDEYLRNLRQAAEEICLAELAEATGYDPLPNAFLEVFRNGLVEDSEPVAPSWHAAFSVYFTEQVKTNERFSRIWFGEKLGTLEKLSVSHQALLEQVAHQNGYFAEDVAAIRNQLDSFASSIGAMRYSLEHLTAQIASGSENPKLLLKAEQRRLLSIAEAAGETLAETEEILSNFRGKLFGRGMEINQLLSTIDQDRSVTLVTGPGGIGKSAVLAAVAEFATSGGVFVARHFFNRGYRATISEEDALRSLLKQVQSWQGTEDRSEIPYDRRTLRDAIHSMLAKDTPDEAPLLILLDGLDEAERIIDAFVPTQLGANVHLMVSCRAEAKLWPDALRSWKRIEKLPCFKRIDLQPITADDITDWLKNELSRFGLALFEPMGIAKKLRRTTDGFPLFLSFVIEDFIETIQSGGAAEDAIARLNDLPDTFTDYVEARLDELDDIGRHDPTAWSRSVRSLFALMSVAKGALMLTELEEILGRDINLRVLDHRVERWFTRRRIDPKRRDTEALSFLHLRFGDIFARVLAQEAAEAGKVLLSYCLESWKSGLSDYALAHIFEHLHDVGDMDKAADLLCDTSFLRKRMQSVDATILIGRTASETAYLAATRIDRLDVLRWRDFWVNCSHFIIEASLMPFGRTNALEQFNQLVFDHMRDIINCSEFCDATIFRKYNSVLPLSDATVFHGHTNRIAGARLISEERVLSWSRDNTLRIWNLSGEGCVILEGHIGPIKNAQELENGLILSWSEDSTLRIWDVHGQTKAVLEGHTASINGAQILENDLILSWSEDGRLRIWDIHGQTKAVLEGHTAPINGARILENGLILSWSEDGTLRIWDVNGKTHALLDGDTSSIDGVEVLENGRILSWSSLGTTFKIWSSDGTALWNVSGHLTCLDGISVLKNGRVLTSASDGIRLWGTNGEAIAVMGRHQVSTRGFKALNDDTILSWDNKNTIHIWDQDGTKLASLKGHTGLIAGVELLHDRIIVSWGEDSALRLWHLQGFPLGVLEGHTGEVSGVNVLPSGRILSWSKDSTVRLWDSSGKALATLEGHSLPVLGAQQIDDMRIISWSADNTLRVAHPFSSDTYSKPGTAHLAETAQRLSDVRTVSWGTDNQIRVWNTCGKLVSVLEAPYLYGRNLKILKDSSILAWAKNNTLQIWHPDTEKLVMLPGHQRLVVDMQELSDGSILSWSYDKTLRLWDVRGVCINEFLGHNSAVNGALELQDGRLLSWSSDKTLRLWERSGEEAITVFEGHHHNITGALELEDGRILSWGEDTTIRIWSSLGMAYAVLQGHTERVMGVRQLNDGRILSWGVDGSLRLWNSNGETLSVVQSHGPPILNAIEMSCGRILSRSAYKASLWGADGQELAQLGPHPNKIKELKVLTDCRIITWCADKSIRLWSCDGTPIGKWVSGSPYSNFEPLEDGEKVFLDVH
ncbi:AAA family ATPase [Labrenzia sp. R4_2]|uniref:AAA family ATPase n=1 Tax=Labrenzia sp. R4_2 TaxID=2821107 RepID=UPI001ADBDF80|nr:AAA family ATPase [Labrenzia sp. R4_2]MBO9422361.1 AAA family ATPase [Labrenzia sp. R4_2]